MPDLIWQLARGRHLDCGVGVRIMGIVNVTPDSFFEGSRFAEPDLAVERGLEQVTEGADLIDVGGESSRPPAYGPATPIPAAEEARRVIPVVEGLRRQTEVPISVDTTKAEVARQALAAGADIINDISALADPDMASVVMEAGAGIILMHCRGTPATMQLNTHYDDVVGEVRDFLLGRAEAALEAGITSGHMALDPGIGFGKSVAGNLMLIRHLDALAALGYPVVLGASRKSFIWKPAGLSARESLEGSLAAAVLGVVHGARVLRVHDVSATVRAVRLAEAVESANAAA